MLGKSIASLAIVMLTAVGVVSTANAQGFVKQFSVEAEQYVVLPPSPPSPIGSPRIYPSGAIVLSMPVGWADATSLPTPFSVRLAGVDWTVEAGDALVRAATWKGGDLETLPKNAIVYCSVSTEAKVLLRDQIAKIGSSKFLGDFAAFVRICAVDSNADGRFDKGFVAGAWHPSYLNMVSVEEAAYAPAEGKRAPGASLDIFYIGARGIGPSFIGLDFLRPPGWTGPGTFDFPDNRPPAGAKESWAEKKEREAKAPSSSRALIAVPKGLPHTVTIGNAKLTIQSIDTATKSAAITIDRDPTPFRFNFRLNVNGEYVSRPDRP